MSIFNLVFDKNRFLLTAIKKLFFLTFFPAVRTPSQNNLVFCDVAVLLLFIVGTNLITRLSKQSQPFAKSYKHLII